MTIEVRSDSHPEVVDLVIWTANFYNLHNVTITVVNAPKKSNFAAQCEQTRRTEKRVFYKLRLNMHAINLYEHGLSQLIFHEMTHVKQYEQDGLGHAGGNKNTWHGQVVYADESNTYEYFDSPWEQDARLAEAKLWYLYRKNVLGCDI